MRPEPLLPTDLSRKKKAGIMAVAVRQRETTDVVRRNESMVRRENVGLCFMGVGCSGFGIFLATSIIIGRLLA